MARFLTEAEVVEIRPQQGGNFGRKSRNGNSRSRKDRRYRGRVFEVDSSAARDARLVQGRRSRGIQSEIGGEGGQRRKMYKISFMERFGEESQSKEGETALQQRKK